MRLTYVVGSILFSGPASSAPVISKPLASQDNNYRQDPSKYVDHLQVLETLTYSYKETGPETSQQAVAVPRAEPKAVALPGIEFSVWEATVRLKSVMPTRGACSSENHCASCQADPEELECRSSCVKRFVPLFAEYEKTVRHSL